MKAKKSIKIPLLAAEKEKLRAAKLSLNKIAAHNSKTLSEILACSEERARELLALAAFQQIPSIGIRFAEDLVFLGYYQLSELQGQDPALLTDAFELKKGYWIDPCVEDQFRLVVYVADSGDYSKNWWDFTEARKQYRAEKGYPTTRPTKAWFELLKR